MYILSLSRSSKIVSWDFGTTDSDFDYGQVRYIRNPDSEDWILRIYNDHENSFPQESIWNVLVPHIKRLLPNQFY